MGQLEILVVKSLNLMVGGNLLIGMVFHQVQLVHFHMNLGMTVDIWKRV